MRASRRMRYHLRRAGFEVGGMLAHLCWRLRGPRWIMNAAEALMYRCYDDVERVWWHAHGATYRALCVRRYPEPAYDERMYVCRIPYDDPRPRGERWRPDTITACAETVPVGHWCEMVFEAPQAPTPTVPSVTTLAPGDGAPEQRSGGIGAGGWTVGEVLMLAGAGMLFAMGWAATCLALIEWWFPKG